MSDPPAPGGPSHDGATTPAIDAGGPESGGSGGVAPSEAFQRLASEERVAVLQELLAAERSGEDTRTFSELLAAADADSSAGFAYHVRQLDGYFVRKSEEGYRLTSAGRAAARAIAAGTFTAGIDADRAS